MAGRNILLLTIVLQVALTTAPAPATLKSDGGMYHIDSNFGNQNFEKLFLSHGSEYTLYCVCAVMRMLSSVWSTYHYIKIT